MLMPKLGCGPMSPDIIEAVFQYSINHPLMLIASRNQIDYDYGYVFHTRIYSEFINEMRSRYPLAKVLICRDHCGPGFSNAAHDSMDSIKETITQDIKYGFDLIHIDLCHLSNNNKEKIDKTLELISFAKNLKPDIMFEVGTDENTGNPNNNDYAILNTLLEIKEICIPEFYVVQTGSLVKGLRNSNNFNAQYLSYLSSRLKPHGVKIKEHNADYLSRDQIRQRRGIVDAMNIAPQLGVAQTLQTLSLANIYGINPDKFIKKAYKGHKWIKWLDKNDSPYDKYYGAILAGHYHFKDDEYGVIIEKLNSYINFRHEIQRIIFQIIDHYYLNFGVSNVN